MHEFISISSPYEAPLELELTRDTSNLLLGDAVARLTKAMLAHVK